MMFKSITRQRYATFLILVVFSVVIALFSAFHSMNVLDGNGTSHQSDAFSCLFTICVAIFIAPMLFTLFLFTTLLFDLIPPFKPAPLFLLEKPPRGEIFTRVQLHTIGPMAKTADGRR